MDNNTPTADDFLKLAKLELKQLGFISNYTRERLILEGLIPIRIEAEWREQNGSNK